MNRRSVLITGGAGFIGSHLCDYFINKDYKVIAIDNFMTGNMSNIKHLNENSSFEFIEHDICKEININQKIDYILHFASPASPKDYLNYPVKTLEIGSTGTQNILKLAQKNNCTILVASTSEVYGDPLEHPQKEDYYGNVNPVGPRGVYDEAKRYLEAITTAYKTKNNLSVRIARIFNSYGPRMRVDDGRAIPSFINQSLNNKNFTVYGNGSQTRSFCYIDDTVKCIYKLLKSNYMLPINIGNNKEHKIIDVLKTIQKINPTNNSVEYLDLPVNDPKKRKPDISLANKLLNWSPKINLVDGLIKTIEYYNNFKK